MQTRSSAPLPPEIAGRIAGNAAGFVPPTGGELPPELSPDFWDRHTRRLFLIAYILVGPRPNRHADAEDVLLAAVERIYSGMRRRPDGVNPVAFVIGVIRSVASHSRSTPAARAVHEPVDDESGTEIEDRHPSAQETAEARELLADFGERLSSLEKRYLVLRIAHEGDTADDHARELEISIAAVRAMDKRLWRLRDEWKGLPRPLKKNRPKHMKKGRRKKQP